jgi:hypothetical protein
VPAADVGATHAGRRLRLGAQALAELAVHVFDIRDVIDEQRRREEGESVHGIATHLETSDLILQSVQARMLAELTRFRSIGISVPLDKEIASRAASIRRARNGHPCYLPI